MTEQIQIEMDAQEFAESHRVDLDDLRGCRRSFQADSKRAELARTLMIQGHTIPAIARFMRRGTKWVEGAIASGERCKRYTMPKWVRVVSTEELPDGRIVVTGRP